MGTLSTRHIVALLCIVLVLFATISAAASPDHFTAVLAPLSLLFAAVTVAVIRRGAPPCDDQPASLLSLVLFRAPPAPFGLV